MLQARWHRVCDRSERRRRWSHLDLQHQYGWVDARSRFSRQFGSVADGPAALLPDGNVLVSASPGIIAKWHGLLRVGRLKPESGFRLHPTPPGNSSWYGRMLVLPTGQVLYTDGSRDVEIYTAAGTANPAWAPSAILSLSSPIISRGSTIMLNGRKFNGYSQAVAYGDDAQAATNYPIMRLTNASTGHVFYCRTHDHSTMAVAYAGPAYTHVDIPSNMETGQNLPGNSCQWHCVPDTTLG